MISYFSPKEQLLALHLQLQAQDGAPEGENLLEEENRIARNVKDLRRQHYT